MSFNRVHFLLRFFVLSVISFLLVPMSLSQNSKEAQTKQAKIWAEELGKNFWSMAEGITKFREFGERFNASKVSKIDPAKIVDDVVLRVSTMMQKKVQAVQAIVDVAQAAAEEFEINDTASSFCYYSSRRSLFIDIGDDSIPPNETAKPDPNAPKKKPEPREYPKMLLHEDSHFYDLYVNTNYSAVHVPSDIFDKHTKPAYTIQWSEKLDKIFLENYNNDPALSWQYFGSTEGILRLFPAYHWNETTIQKDFDCRMRTWFIEAATCTKDVVILLDNSGSMDGMTRTIAAATVTMIMKSFSNNDYLNVMNFSTRADYVVPCFADMLVQATKENVDVFNAAIKGLKPGKKTVTDEAIKKAFQLLYQYRPNCDNVNGSDTCNQAIMLVTDAIPEDISGIVEEYNRNLTVPIRIFTYMVGSEATGNENSLKVACENRGYHTTVNSLEQISASVIEYIRVLARPLVLQQDDHPPSWTHAYMDPTVTDMLKYRLVTSVAVPAYDVKENLKNDTKTAYLLGVAATDVPIEDISKLTYPYKIGVNGYSFIVSNNGYVLKHPDLRPMFQDQLKINYNSIDFTEVEQFFDKNSPRVIDPRLLELRDNVTLGKKDTAQNIYIKYHYDQMRRVSKELYDYYYAPITDTPFTLGLALPEKFGNHHVDIPDLITGRKFQTTDNLTAKFEKYQWSVHPDWVYCKYHYLESNEFNTSEDELRFFLGKVYESNFTWQAQYETGQTQYETGQTQNQTGQTQNQTEEDQSGKQGTRENVTKKTHGPKDYYCDKELMIRLVFDLITIDSILSEGDAFDSVTEKLIADYNATFRFVATMSGLTIWQNISEVTNPKEFGIENNMAIDMTWYKSAVLQYQKEKESFVFSVPFEHTKDANVPVTASYAIITENIGLESPACVVGYQFGQKGLAKAFANITNTLHTDDCDGVPCQRCNDTSLNCYIVDANGYVIAGGKNVEKDDDIGKFFGIIDGNVMESMREAGIFDVVTIYDYQAYCEKNPDEGSSASFLKSPFLILQSWINTFIMDFYWSTFKFSVYDLWYAAFAQEEEVGESTEEDILEEIIQPYKPETYPCEKETDAYYLEQENFNKMDPFHGLVKEEHQDRNYYVSRVPHSNLILIAVEPSTDPNINIDIFKKKYSPRALDYDSNFTDLACQKKALNSYTRKKLSGCYNTHQEEKDITECSRSRSPKTKTQVLLLLSCISLIVNIST